MITQTDQARLNKLAESASSTPKISDGELDALGLADLQIKLREMTQKDDSWAVVVTTTEQHPRQWWLHLMMLFFRNGLSLMDMTDGRLAICTWAVR